MGDGKVATYGVKVETQGADSAQDTADALERLLKMVDGSKASIREYSDSLRNLRGSSDQVRAAKEQLKTSIEAEKNKISESSLALLKQGTSYARVSSDAKAAAEAQKKFREALEKKRIEDARVSAEAFDKSIKSAAGPVQELRERMSSLKETFTTSAGAAAAMVGVAAAVGAGLVELAKSVVDLTHRFLEWLVVTGLAERSANLLRQAWTGSAKDAVALGHQLDALAEKVSTPREELQKLGGELVRSMAGTRASGKAIIDTFNAVAQASAAMGDTAGAKIREIIERSKQFGRVQINPLELQGTGIQSKDVAGELAKQLHISVAQAQQELLLGRVKIDDAAAALRAAVEHRFGEVNAKLKLGDVVGGLKKRLDELTKGIDWEPLLKGVEQLSLLFDKSTVSGSVLKQLIGFVANELGPAFDKAVPIVKHVFLQLEIAALKIAIQLKHVKERFAAAFTDQEKVQAFAAAMGAISWAIGNAADSLSGFIDLSASVAIAMGRGIEGLQDWTQGLVNVGAAIREKVGEWVTLGSDLVEGLIQGITSKAASVKDAVTGLGEQVKQALKDALGIHSPSKIFEEYGRQTSAGYERGVSQGAPGAQSAVDRMAPGAPAAGPAAPGGRGGGSPVHVTVQIIVQGGGDPQATAKAVAGDGVMRQITKAIVDACVTLGLPVQTEATP